VSARLGEQGGWLVMSHPNKFLFRFWYCNTLFESLKTPAQGNVLYTDLTKAFDTV